jgi:CHAD domain-containing protein
MPLDHKLSLRNFEKLKRQLSKLTKNSAPESVHRFRTYARRIEVLLGEVVPAPSGNEKKLVKLLTKLRKKAGKVRDLDVQIGLLRNLKSPQAPGHKAQLQRVLTVERGRREKKLQKLFDKKMVAELRKRVRRAEREFEVPDSIEPLGIAQGLMARVQVEGATPEEALHHYRIAGKRARYVAEMAADSPEAKELTGLLKSMQDAIGDWHDWLQLTEHAEQLFGGVQDSSLVAQLRNVTRAKYREAVRVLGITRTALAGKPPSAERKLPLRIVKASSVA